MTKIKKRNPQDTTLRNIRALKKVVAKHAEKIKTLEGMVKMMLRKILSDERQK